MKTPIAVLAAALSLLASAAHAQQYVPGEDPGDEYQQYPTQQEPQPQYEEQQAPQQQMNFEMFQGSLAQYGEWLDAPGYGTVWRPWNVAAGWRPYTQGRWAWTAYGWTWAGIEPWSWATDHYGRWLFISELGWCWMPDYTWGPAWVSFRFGQDYVGWAPLAPGYGYEDTWYDEYAPNYASWSFVSYNSFYVGPNVVDYNLCGSIYAPSYVRANIWVSTRPARVFGYGGGQMYGPPCDYVSSRTHAPVTSVPIHAASGIAGAHPGFDGHSVNVVTPPFHGVKNPFGGQATVPGGSVVGVGHLLNSKSNPPVQHMNLGGFSQGNHGTVAPQTARPAPPSQQSRPAFNQPERPQFGQPPSFNQPRPSFNEPQRPAFTQPQRPAFTQPQRPVFNEPQRPAFTQPQRPVFQQPTFTQPSRPAYQQPTFTQPSRPAFQQPSFQQQRPVFQQPSRPTFSAPSRPSFQPAPSRQSFSAPSHPSFSAPSHASFGGRRR